MAHVLMDAKPQNNQSLGRLTKRSEFLYVRDGLYRAVGGVVIQARANPGGGPEIRVGFTATKRIGNAVTRNRAKRRLREAARALLADNALPGYDYVFIARDSTTSRPWQDLLDDVQKALIWLRAKFERDAQFGGAPSGPDRKSR